MYGKKGVKGRTIELDVTMDKGSLEDVLRLAVKTAKPVMTGAISLTTKLLIPPGEKKVADRLQLDGRFAIEHARFTDRGVQQKLAALSRRSQGKAADEPLDRRRTDPVGDEGPVHAPRRRSALQSTDVRCAGRGRDGHRAVHAARGAARLRGDVRDGRDAVEGSRRRMEEPGPEGVRSAVPRPHAGAVLPIRITGTREDPQFGVDIGKALRRK